MGGYQNDNENGYYSGHALVLSGRNWSTLHRFKGEGTADSFGWSVSGAGDVNGDGFDDLIVGAKEDDNSGSGSGSARVFSGQNGSVFYTFDGDSAGDRFGGAVSSAGDVNGDGYADLIVGANGDDNNGTDSGSARVFSGWDGSVLYTFNGDSAGDYFGSSVSGACDVNGDGFDDLIVGAYGDDNNGINSGSARLFSGYDGSVLYTFTGDSPADYLGFSVSGAGSVNGDGLADLIIGAYGADNNGTDSGRAYVFISEVLGGDIRSVQTITFAALANKTFGDAPFTLSATASSELSVSFAVTNGPATISSNVVTITGAGTVSIVASQGGNSNYLAATSVTQSFTVAKGLAAVTLNNLAQTYNGTERVVTATTFPTGLTVVVTYNGSSTAPTAAGSYAVIGTINEAFYDGLTNGTLTVAQAVQSITFDSLTNKIYGDAPFDLTTNASASSGLPITFAVASGPATINSNIVTITGAGSVTITASQAGNTNYLAATSVDKTFTVFATVVLHPGAHGSIAQANSGSDYMTTVTNGAAFPVVTVTPNAGAQFTGWNPSAPATITNNFEGTAKYRSAISQPLWWIDYGVLKTNQPNDFAIANLGQLKHVAKKAFEAMEASVGAGTNITPMVASSNDYYAANLGQLKYVAKPFYDRLWALGLTNLYPAGAGTNKYPWQTSTNAARDYAPANIGQLKYLFSFELE